jgi:hypothetical protein
MKAQRWAKDFFAAAAVSFDRRFGWPPRLPAAAPLFRAAMQTDRAVRRDAWSGDCVCDGGPAETGIPRSLMGFGVVKAISKDIPLRFDCAYSILERAV